jgi:hypothetical protein
MLLYEVCCLDSLDCATDTTALPLDSEGSMDGSTKGLYRSNYYPLPTVMELQILPIASRTLWTWLFWAATILVKSIDSTWLWICKLDLFSLTLDSFGFYACNLVQRL